MSFLFIGIISGGISEAFVGQVNKIVKRTRVDITILRIECIFHEPFGFESFDLFTLTQIYYCKNYTANKKEKIIKHMLKERGHTIPSVACPESL
jgi:DNA polymerase sigma